MKRFLSLGAVMITAMFCVPGELPACERLTRRVGTVATTPLRLLKAVHQRRHARAVEHSASDTTVSIQISVVE